MITDEDEDLPDEAFSPPVRFHMMMLPFSLLSCSSLFKSRSHISETVNILLAVTLLHTEL